MKSFKFMKYIVILLTITSIISCKSTGTKYILGLREKIHHDDFEYSVSNYIVSRFLKNGADTLHARGVFYLVLLKVENNARRVNHKWNNSIGYIMDERGNTYENLPEVQEFWNKVRPFGLKDEYITRASVTDSTYLAFDLPFDVTKPFFKVRGEVLMGDMLDRARFRKMMVRLF